MKTVFTTSVVGIFLMVIPTIFAAEIPADFAGSRNREESRPPDAVVASEGRESLDFAKVYYGLQTRAERSEAIRKQVKSLPIFPERKDAFGVPSHGAIRDAFEEETTASTGLARSEDPDSLFAAAMRSLEIAISCPSEHWIGLGGEEIVEGDVLTVEFRDRTFKGRVERLRDGAVSIRSMTSESSVDLQIPCDKDEFAFDSGTDPDLWIPETRRGTQPVAGGAGTPAGTLRTNERLPR